MESIYGSALGKLEMTKEYLEGEIEKLRQNLKSRKALTRWSIVWPGSSLKRA